MARSGLTVERRMLKAVYPDPARLPSAVVINPVADFVGGVGNTMHVSAEVRNAGGQALPSRQIRWLSSNPSIATITNAGRVTGRSVGDCLLYAYDTQSGIASAASLSISTSAVYVTPLPASAVFGVAPPTVANIPPALSLTPSPVASVFGAAAPTVSMGAVGLTPTPATADFSIPVPTVSIPGGGMGAFWREHEPAALVGQRIFEWQFDEAAGLPPLNTPVQSGYGLLEGKVEIFAGLSNLSVVSSHVGPVSPAAGLRTRWPTSLPSGSAPCNITMWHDTGVAKKCNHLYLARHIYFEPNSNGKFWLGTGNITKAGFLGLAKATSQSHNEAFFSYYHAGNAVELAQWSLGFEQQGGGPAVRLETSQATFPNCFRVGMDHFLEAELLINDIGLANGLLNIWLRRSDGFAQQIFAFNDWEYRTAANPLAFFDFLWNPTWGGGTGFHPGEDTFENSDAIYMSGI